MKTVPVDNGQVATLASVSARVLADARRSFTAEVDAATLKHQEHEVVLLFWTETSRATTFIPLLALRDLRERLVNVSDASQARRNEEVS